MHQNQVRQGIAIIGMSCRFPGANGLEEFWDLLSKGASAFESIPEDRKHQYDFQAVRCDKGAFLKNPFYFDNEYFKISEKEAMIMDPQQRIMLELSVEAKEHAAIQNFKDQNVGVFIGANQRAYGESISTTFYRKQLIDYVKGLKSIQAIPASYKEKLFSELNELEQTHELTSSAITGNISNMIAGRISHEFNLSGPSICIDTACSSSLVAVHLACESLYNRECDLAFAGGVNLNLTPSIFLFMQAAQVISASGNCIPFSKISDGILLGEGAGLIMLKRFEEAAADGDRILGIIRGSGINNDGRSMSVMAPSWKGQLRLLESTFLASGYDPSQITAIEAHGTSTRLGDSIEVSVLERFFYRPQRQLSIGSVKSNIGHLLGAAGIAGLIKMVLAMNNKQLPPSLHGSGPNPKWKLNEKKLKIQDVLEEWKPEGLRAAGVSAFGFGGTNAHIILEEPDPVNYKPQSRKINKTRFAGKYFNYALFPGMKTPDEALYTMDWHVFDLAEKKQDFHPDHWLVFCDKEPFNTLDKLTAASMHYSVVQPGTVFSRLDEFTYTINESNEDHYRWLISGLDNYPSLGVLYICRKNIDKDPSATEEQLLSLKHLFKYASQRNTETRLWGITFNAFNISADEKVVPRQRAFASLINGVLEEIPSLQGGLIDLDESSQDVMDCLIKTIGRQYTQPLVIRNNKAYKPALSPVAHSNTSKNNITIKSEGVYLVIGGSSGIGEALALYIAGKNAAKMIISGTRPAGELSERMKSLVEVGNIDYRQSSVTCREEIQALIDNIYKHEGRLDGIILSAGSILYGSLTAKSEQELEKTIHTKISGVNFLYEAIKGRPVDFVYLLSSVSGLSPAWAKGIADYAASNAYLDAFAERFTSETTKWLSRSWSIWEETGMSKGIKFSTVNTMQPIPRQEALALFERSLHSGQVHLAVMNKLDAVKFSFAYSTANENRLPKVIPAKAPEAAVSSVVEIRDNTYLLKQLIAEATEMPLAEVDENESFSNLGLDSISAIDIVNSIEKDYGLSLHPTLLYEYDTVTKLADYLEGLNRKEPVPKSADKQILYPLLPSQKTFYTNQIFYPDAPCNLLAKLDFVRQFDIEILNKAWNIVLREHESLRLSFDMTDEGPVQHIAQLNAQKIQHHRLGNLEKSVDQLKVLEEQLVNKIYHLHQAPLFDLCYISFSSGQSCILLSVHHIITDAWSMSLILKELLETYKHLHADNPVQQDDSTALFSAYIHHYGNKDSSEDSTGTRNYWLEELKDTSGTIHLPYNKEASSEQKTTNLSLSLSLDEDTTGKIEKAAQLGHSSLFHLLVSAHFLMLHKISGQDDLIIRLASANRDSSFPNIRNLTGCLADAIPLRIRLESQDDLLTIAGRVKSKLLQYSKYSTLSSIDYSSIMKSRQQCGPVGITPVGMSFVNFDHLLEDTTAECADIQCRTALPFTDLSLLCWKYKSRLHFSWNYSYGTFSYSTIEEISETYRKILLKSIGGKGIISDKEVVPQIEMPEVQLFSSTKLLHEKVFLACDRYKGRTAIMEKDHILNYTDLKANAYQIANALIRLTGHELEAIGLLAYPGALATCGIVGILASGHAYITLDPDWPYGRIEDIIANSEIEVLLTSSIHLQKFLGNEKPFSSLKTIILLDDPQTEVPAHSSLKIHTYNQQPQDKLLLSPKNITAENLAYIMYTSGTTGVPKGVMVQHKAVEVFLNWVSEAFGINATDRFIHTSSLGFGGSIRQIFSTLLAGGEIHPIDRLEFKDPQSLLEFMKEHKITILNTVPAVLNNICNYLDQLQTEERFARLNDLRLILVGGEVLHGELITKWRSHFGNKQQIVNLYGSTETIVNATMYFVSLEEHHDLAVPIGKARKGSHVLLLNEQGRLCRTGEKGELYVGGPSIAVGYYKAGDYTKEKFVQPDLPGISGIYYRTGDLAVRDEEGILHYLGRNDNQIQIYGNRVEPSEVESVIYTIEGVKNSAVVDFQEENRHWLVAFVELKANKENVTEADIRNTVAEKLPAYMVPHKVVFLAKMPFTHAGKIDRITLQKNDELQFLRKSEQEEQTQTESLVAAVWREVLKEDQLAPDQDFFSLGGDSILAIEVLHKLKKHFAQVPKPIVLFRKRTVKELAAALNELNEQSQAIAHHESLINNIAQEQVVEFPLSYSQKGFIWVQKLHPTSSPNWVASIPIHGKLKQKVLQQALNFLLKRHPMLRTIFMMEGLHTTQKVMQAFVAKIEFDDISQTPDIQQQEMIHASFEAFKNLDIKLSELPLFRIKIYKISEGASVLLLCIHHIIGDAWSLKILTDELLHVYDQLLNGGEMYLEPLKASYLDVVKHESEKENISEQTEKLREHYWDEIFKSLPAMALNRTDLADDTAQEDVSLLISLHQKERLKSACLEKGISMFHLLFTIYARVLHQLLNNHRLLISTSLSGRDLPVQDVDKLIGCFARSLPVSIQFNSIAFFDNLKEVGEAFYNAAENADISPEKQLKVFLKNNSDTVYVLFRFFLSYIDFSALSSYKSSHISLQWKDAHFYYNTGSIGSDLMLGVMVSDVIHIHFYGKANAAFKKKVRTLMEEEISNVLKIGHEIKQWQPSAKSEKEPFIDAALIAYFPSLSSLKDLLSLGKLNGKLSKEIITKLLPDNKPRLLEIESTGYGCTGLVLLPLLADELFNTPQEQLLKEISKAIKVSYTHGARYISLAGNLPSRTNYGFNVIEEVGKDNYHQYAPVITTGHSCTVVAVVKTIEKVLKALDLPINLLTIGVAGFGSIGQASLSLLLSQLGHPASLIIADLATQLPSLQRPLSDLRKKFLNKIEVLPVADGVMPNAFYSAHLMIGASSNGNIIEVKKILPGTVLVDDSFPHIIDTKKAIQRMKKDQDVLIIGGGKMNLDRKERFLMDEHISMPIVKNVLQKVGDEGMPGCQIESLLMSYDNTLPSTQGLVSTDSAKIYWEKVKSLKLKAVVFHLQGYAVDAAVVENVKCILSKMKN